MIDIDHHQRERPAVFVGPLPFAIECTIEAAPVGQPSQAVEARQLIEVLNGDLQFLLPRGELVRHVVEGRRERLEFRDPWLVGRPHIELAATKTRRHARQQPDRPQDQSLAAKPGGQKNKHAEHAKLHVRDADLPVDAAMHDRFIEADREPRLRPRHADESEDAADAVEAGRRYRALVIGQHVVRQSVRRESFADISRLIGRSANERATAVDECDRCARPPRGRLGKIADPLQIDRRHDRPADSAVLLDDRVNRHHAGNAFRPADQIVAEHEIAGIEHALEVGTVAHVQATARGSVAQVIRPSMPTTPVPKIHGALPVRSKSI